MICWCPPPDERNASFGLLVSVFFCINHYLLITLVKFWVHFMPSYFSPRLSASSAVLNSLHARPSLLLQPPASLWLRPPLYTLSSISASQWIIRGWSTRTGFSVYGESPNRVKWHASVFVTTKIGGRNSKRNGSVPTALPICMRTKRWTSYCKERKLPDLILHVGNRVP